MDEETTDETTSDEGGVLSPDELDITAEDNVVEIGDGRYVISPGDGEPRVPSGAVESVGTRQEPSEEVGADEGKLSDEVVHRWLADRLAAADSKYAFDVTACFEGQVSQRELFSNDVVTTFENLVTWYSNHAGSDTPVEDVLGILLLESNLSVRFPTDSLKAFVVAQGLEGTDSIEDLFDATLQAGGVRFPPDVD